VRCTRCGNENPGTNRFCGMCGAILLPATPTQGTAAAPKPPVSAPVPAPPATAPKPVIETRPIARIPEPEPVISGPSFLGLGRPAASPSQRRASLSIDPNAAPASRDVGYLLDDEEPVRGGSGKYILMFVALLLAVGLGYLRWKNHDFAFLTPGTSKPAATVQPADTPDSAASMPNTNTNPSTSTAPSGDAGTATAPDSTSAPANAAANPPVANAALPAATPSTPAAKDPAASGTVPTSAPPTSSAAQPSTKDDSDEADTPDTAPAAKPESSAKPAASKPTAATPVSADPVTEAQKYLYGRGVRQDCEHGLRLLKPAANRANPRAMIEMGALYSAGLCTPHDLPTAYRWFAMALHKDPDNQSVQTDLQKLWGEMTQPERQLAIKLSQ
jgi:hypothetical protein